MKTYQRVFGRLGQQKFGHCKAVNHAHLEGLIKCQLDIAVAQINLALDIKRRSLG